jgi:hypothetical protein
MTAWFVPTIAGHAATAVMIPKTIFEVFCDDRQRCEMFNSSLDRVCSSSVGPSGFTLQGNSRHFVLELKLLIDCGEKCAGVPKAATTTTSSLNIHLPETCENSGLHGTSKIMQPGIPPQVFKRPSKSLFVMVGTAQVHLHADRQ